MVEKLTMSQMAKELRVSRSVVSAVLNNNKGSVRVSDETRRRIKEHLRDRGYVQSKSALQLRQGGQQELVSLLYCGKFVDTHALVEALSYLTAGVKETDNQVEIYGVDPAHLHDGLKEQVAKGGQRMIWIHANTPDEEIVNAQKLFPLLRRMQRVVIYDYDFGESSWDNEYLRQGINLIGPSRETAYREAAALFATDGHFAVALNDAWAGSDEPLPGNSMLTSIFREQGLKIHGLYPRGIPVPGASAEVLTRELIRLHKTSGVQAAFIRNDKTAAEVIDLLMNQGIRVPDDIGIIGFGNCPYGQWLRVPLTTFEYPVREMCNRALELVRAPFDAPTESLILPPQLIKRKSHGPVQHI